MATKTTKIAGVELPETLDIRPVRVTMDSNGSWHAIQTPDANLELTFSRKTLKLIRVRLLK